MKNNIFTEFAAAKQRENELYFAVKKFIKCGEGGRLLDLNFGGDRLLGSISELGLNLYGVDISDSEHERTIDEIALNGRASINELPYNDEFFDTVTTVDTLCGWSGERGFSEILRVLKHGGQLLCSFHAVGITPQQARSLARRAGFVNVTVKVLRAEDCYLLIGEKE